jgi:hypothetical protein
LSLLELLTELKNNAEEKGRPIQNYLMNLDLLDFFGKILSSKDHFHYYTHNLFTSHASRQIQISFILAVVSLMNFEYYKGLAPVNRSSIDSRMFEFDGENDGVYLRNLDFSLGIKLMF